MKKTLFLLIAISFFLCGCTRKGDEIAIYGQTKVASDDIHIVLNDGYFVEGFSVDYESEIVTLNLCKK